MPGLYLLDPRAEPAADYLCKQCRATFAICRFLRRRFRRYDSKFDDRATEPKRGQKKDSTAVSNGCRTPGVAGAIEIERWRGLAALDRPGPLQDNRGKRAKGESAHGCGFISMSSFSAMKPPEDKEGTMIDSLPVMAWRCRPDGFVEFFYRRWLEYTGLSLDQALGWG
jgi:PAS domain-containing protein